MANSRGWAVSLMGPGFTERLGDRMTALPTIQTLRAALHPLRKHALLLAVLVAAVFALGALYASRQEPVFAATATVQIKPRPATWLANELWIDEDRKFISDQVYRIQSDSRLARKVEARLRAWAEAPELPEALREGFPRDEFIRAVRALPPGSIGGGVTVTPIPETSYYEIRVTAADRRFVVALANAYAEETTEQFREENSRAIQGQVEDWERDWQKRRDFSQERLTGLRQELEKLQGDNPQVDFGKTGASRTRLESADRDLWETREKLEGNQVSLKAANAVLSSVGLTLETRDLPSGRQYFLKPEQLADAAADPRLSPFVQTLEVVEKDEGVRRVREQIRALEEMDRSYAVGPPALVESTPERKALRGRVVQQRAELARHAEAALCGLARSVEELGARLARLQGRLRDLESEASVAAGVLGKADALHRRIEDLVREIESYDGRLAESARLRKTVIEAGFGASTLVRKIQDALPASVRQVAPDFKRIWTATTVLAILMVLALLWLFHTLDDTVRSREDFDRLVHGIPLLGVVPSMGPSSNGEFRVAALHHEIGTPVVEAIRALRTSLQYAGEEGRSRTILVTSCGPREGKTTLSLNLAATFAQGGQKTLLVDGDMRRARVHRALGMESGPGLSNVLTGKATLKDVVRPSGAVEGLDVLIAGPLPPNPAELLEGPLSAEFFAEASKLYSRIVVDSPPIVTVTDPCILARRADAVLLVISHGETPARLIRRAREVVEGVGSRFHGAVINNAAPGGGFYGDSYYGYYGYSPYTTLVEGEGENGSKRPS